MINLSKFIFKDEGKFYFDPENYSLSDTEDHHLTFEDGDSIIWNWEGARMYGTLRSQSNNINLFVLEKVGTIK